MNFSNINPADRNKVFALAGAIALVVFLFVHTLIGALRPKKPATPVVTQQTAGAVPAPPAPPQVANASSIPANMDTAEAFPSDQAAMDSSKLHNSDLGLDIHDPFKPLYGTGKQNQTQDSRSNPAPEVSVSPASAPGVNPLPALGNGSTPPPALLDGGGNVGKLGTMPLTPLPPPDPTIKLLGIVRGESSVASIQVNTQTIIAQPGRALTKGYRLISVSGDGVQIRHDNANVHLNVGDVINPPSGN